MNFWIFMMVCNLIIPLIVITLGKYYSNNAPKNINNIVGYRTSLSMKNKETWEFAHNYCGKLWFKMGWYMLLLSIIAMISVVNGGEKDVSLVGAAVCIIETIAIVISVFIVEKALKDNFDNNGIRKVK